MGAMSLLVGLLIGVAWITKDAGTGRLDKLPPDVRARLNRGDNAEVERQVEDLQAQVRTLREQITRYEETLAKESGNSKALNEALQEIKIGAGLTELIGPGIVVTLTDSRRDDLPPEAGIIHDRDILPIVNELRAAGAEAIAIGNQRVVATTSIRCVGPVVQVNSVGQAAPIEIYALGDPDELAQALELPMGVLEELRQTDPAMVKVEQLKEIKLPAFSGSTKITLSRVPEASK